MVVKTNCTLTTKRASDRLLADEEIARFVLRAFVNARHLEGLAANIAAEWGIGRARCPQRPGM